MCTGKDTAGGVAGSNNAVRYSNSYNTGRVIVSNDSNDDGMAAACGIKLPRYGAVPATMREASGTIVRVLCGVAGCNDSVPWKVLLRQARFSGRRNLFERHGGRGPQVTSEMVGTGLSALLGTARETGFSQQESRRRQISIRSAEWKARMPQGSRFPAFRTGSETSYAGRKQF
jgi:hypothetical protein